jgi:hypothetical protein
MSACMDDSSPVVDRHAFGTRPRVAVVTVSYGPEAVIKGFLASLDGIFSGSPITVIAENRS